jgi:hypothetical protein
LEAVALTQGAYYLVSGAWSVVHIDSFQKVTGRKTDLWLVKSVGLLLGAIGAGLIHRRLRPAIRPGTRLRRHGECRRSARHRTGLCFQAGHLADLLADALVELGFLIWWAAYLR